MPPVGPAPHLDLEGVDPLSVAVFAALMRTLHVQRQAVTRSLAAKGRSFSQAGCLRILVDNDGISQKDLAVTLHLSRPSVTTMLNGMEQEGLIVRRADDRDRRLTRVHLTEKGRELEGDMRSGMSSYLNRTVGSLSEKDRKDLARLLGKLAESISNVMTEPAIEEVTTE